MKLETPTHHRRLVVHLQTREHCVALGITEDLNPLELEDLVPFDPRDFARHLLADEG